MMRSLWGRGVRVPPLRCFSPATAAASCSSIGRAFPAIRPCRRISSGRTGRTVCGSGACSTRSSRRIARRCLPFSFDFGDYLLDGEPPPADGQKHALSPRRFVLDKILVDAAAEAGAEVRAGAGIASPPRSVDRPRNSATNCSRSATRAKTHLPQHQRLRG